MSLLAAMFSVTVHICASTGLCELCLMNSLGLNDLSLTRSVKREKTNNLWLLQSVEQALNLDFFLFLALVKHFISNQLLVIEA